MKHVSILVPKGQYSIVNIAASFQILSAANDFYMQRYQKPLLKVDLVSTQKPAKDEQGWYSVYPTKLLHEIDQTDLIVVPAVHGEHNTVIEENSELVTWLSKKYKEGSEIATFCIGVFIVAASGLLNGKECSTHWGEAPNLKSMFPEVIVKSENFVTECDGIYSSGGAFAFTNLLLYLIEKYGDRELAILVAKTFMLDIDKVSQSPFMIFRGLKEHKDHVVLNVQNFIENHYRDKFTVELLAEKNAVSKRTLERRFKKATDNSINEYAQRVRTEVAKKQFEEGSKSVNEVMFITGYNDSKSFREVFKKYVGISPVEYREKYSKLH